MNEEMQKPSTSGKLLDTVNKVPGVRSLPPVKTAILERRYDKSFMKFQTQISRGLDILFSSENTNLKNMVSDFKEGLMSTREYTQRMTEGMKEFAYKTGDKKFIESSNAITAAKEELKDYQEKAKKSSALDNAKNTGKGALRALVGSTLLGQMVLVGKDLFGSKRTKEEKLRTKLLVAQNKQNKLVLKRTEKQIQIDNVREKSKVKFQRNLDKIHRNEARIIQAEMEARENRIRTGKGKSPEQVKEREKINEKFNKFRQSIEKENVQIEKENAGLARKANPKVDKDIQELIKEVEIRTGKNISELVDSVDAFKKEKITETKDFDKFVENMGVKLTEKNKDILLSQFKQYQESKQEKFREQVEEKTTEKVKPEKEKKSITVEEFTRELIDILKEYQKKGEKEEVKPETKPEIKPEVSKDDKEMLKILGEYQQKGGKVEEVEPEVRPEIKPIEPITPEVSPEIKPIEPITPEVRPEIKPIEPITPEVRPEFKPIEPITPEVRPEIVEQGKIEPIKEEKKNLVVDELKREDNKKFKRENKRIKYTDKREMKQFKQQMKMTETADVEKTLQDQLEKQTSMDKNLEAILEKIGGIEKPREGEKKEGKVEKGEKKPLNKGLLMALLVILMPAIVNIIKKIGEEFKKNEPILKIISDAIKYTVKMISSALDMLINGIVSMVLSFKGIDKSKYENLSTMERADYLANLDNPEKIKQLEELNNSLNRYNDTYEQLKYGETKKEFVESKTSKGVLGVKHIMVGKNKELIPFGEDNPEDILKHFPQLSKEFESKSQLSISKQDFIEFMRKHPEKENVIGNPDEIANMVKEINEEKQIPEKQFGGSVKEGNSYIVGEKRPEVFTPDRSGLISTNANKFVTKDIEDLKTKKEQNKKQIKLSEEISKSLINNINNSKQITENNFTNNYIADYSPLTDILKQILVTGC